MYTMCANASNNTPSYSHVRSYMVWKVHPLGWVQPYEFKVVQYVNLNANSTNNFIYLFILSVVL